MRRCRMKLFLLTCTLFSFVPSQLSADGFDCTDFTRKATSCRVCGFWWGSHQCDYIKVGTRTGSDFVPCNKFKDCSTECPEENPVVCHYGQLFTISSPTWQAGLDIDILDFATFKFQYNSKQTTNQYDCRGSEPIAAGTCGEIHYTHIQFDWEQRAYHRRVYDMEMNCEMYGSRCDCYQDGWVNPKVCNPCSGTIALGRKYSGCFSTTSKKTACKTKGKWVSACPTPN